MIRRYEPILRTAAACFLSFISLTASHWDALLYGSPPVLAFWFLAGILYLQFLEYGMHRFAMHKGLPLLGHVRRNHIEHHRIFYGSNFRTSSPPHLTHIPGRWWIFPVLFSFHFLAATAILPRGPAIAFLCACFVHYLAFEVSHWFTHLDDNAFDRFLARVPVLGALRAYQIEHHRIHHETPIVGFNFNPPYLGDVVSGRLPAPVGAGNVVPKPAIRIEAPPAPRPALAVPRRRLVLRPLVLYGTALILGAAAVGVAVLAQSKSAPGNSAPRNKM